MTPEQTALVERTRALVGDGIPVREVSMFGGRSVMVNDRILVSALTDGSLLVRVDAARHDDLVARPGARQATMGRGRTMGQGLIEVAAETVGDEEHLAFWIEAAMDNNRSSACGQAPAL